MTEESLSDQRIETLSNSDKVYYAEENVKEFINIIKIFILAPDMDRITLLEQIDKLAGEKLTDGGGGE